jgi:hypothetical protein
MQPLKMRVNLTPYLAKKWPFATPRPDRPARAGPCRVVDGDRDVQAMTMTFWLPQTEAVLAQVEGR